MNVVPIIGKNATLALWAWNGHTTSNTTSTMTSTIATAMFTGRQLLHHTPAAKSSCSGFSQSIRILGDVASCVDMNTRNVTTQPARPRMPNHAVYTIRTILFFFHCQRQSGIASANARQPQKSGVRYHGVGPAVASGTPSLSTRVSLTSGRPSAKCALPAFRIISRGANIS